MSSYVITKDNFQCSYETKWLQQNKIGDECLVGSFCNCNISTVRFPLQKHLCESSGGSTITEADLRLMRTDTTDGTWEKVPYMAHALNRPLIGI